MNKSCNCGPGSALIPHFTEGQMDFHRCSGCGLLMRWPMPTPEELTGIYAELYRADLIASGDTHQESGTLALQRYAKYLCRHFGRAKPLVVDYGSGTGELPELLRQEGLHCDGVEMSEAARAWCLAHRNIELLPTLAALEARSRDLVCMIEVIEHLPEPIRALAAVKRVMRPGGSIFITTPNRRGLRARLEGGHWKEARKRFHVLLFDARSLRQLLTSSGFTEVTWIQFPPVLHHGASRWVSTRLQQLVGMGGTLCMIARKPFGDTDNGLHEGA